MEFQKEDDSQEIEKHQDDLKADQQSETQPESPYQPDDSNEEIEIELSESLDNDMKSVPGKKPVRIRIDTSVRNQMIQHASADTTKERGGILVGTVHDDEIVYIEAMIPARYTDASSASLKFTHETWNDIYEVKDRLYPGKKIVGWYHTHPGMGVFLSQFDLHIHENFFNLNWQIAYVLDPVTRTEGFFRWEEGKIQKTIQYEFIGAVPYVGPINNPDPPSRFQPVIPRRFYWERAALILLLFMVGLLNIHQFRTYEKLKQIDGNLLDIQTELNQEILPKIESMDESIAKVESELNQWSAIRSDLEEIMLGKIFEMIRFTIRLYNFLINLSNPLDIPNAFKNILPKSIASDIPEDISKNTIQVSDESG